jgi:hypothetical protein
VDRASSRRSSKCSKSFLMAFNRFKRSSSSSGGGASSSFRSHWPLAAALPEELGYSSRSTTIDEKRALCR